VRLNDQVGRFVHDAYRQFFLDSGMANRIDIHERLVDCLRRPAAGRLRDALRQCSWRRAAAHAAALGVQAALVRIREGRDWQDLPAGVLEAIAFGATGSDRRDLRYGA